MISEEKGPAVMVLYNLYIFFFFNCVQFPFAKHTKLHTNDSFLKQVYTESW